MEDLSELTDRDIRICEAMAKWISTAKLFGDQSQYGPEWIPTKADIMKSRLFWRIRSGKEPLLEPPPRAFSCPWYEVVEEPGSHHCFELYLDPWQGKLPGKVGICQHLYDLVERTSETSAIVKFGSIKYKVWLDDKKLEKYPGLTGGFIQRL